MQTAARGKSLLLALVPAAAAAIGALSARASIIYQDIADVHLVTAGTQGNVSTYLDFDSDGVNDFQFQLYWNHSSEGTQWTRELGPGSVVYRQTFPTSGAEPLPLAFSIGPNLASPPPNNSRTWNASGILGNTVPGDQNLGWWSGQRAYLGVRFSKADGDHYGWVDMSATSGTIDIYSFAYETEVSAPIAAGAIPSPGTGLVLLAPMLGMPRRRSRSS